jgi:nucleoside-diphosphate-sugar epimerase
MKILVTGAGGMVGSHMVEMLDEEGHDVLGTYYKPTVDINEIKSTINMLECDVRYPQRVEKIISDFLPQQIYHMAAQSYPVVSWECPYETIETNVGGTVGIFEAVKKLRKSRSGYDPVVVIACSSAEYGQTLDNLNGEKVKETAQLEPLHPYGVSKVGQDLLAFQYYKNDGIKTIRARIFNTTGTRKVGDVTSDFVRRVVDIEKGEVTPVLRVGNIETKRAIMDFRDLVSALQLLAVKGTYGDVYNISSEKVYQVKEIISIIEKLTNKHYEIRIDNALLRPTDEKVIVGDVTKLKRDTGWKQVVSLEATIDEMLRYWRKRKR